MDVQKLERLRLLGSLEQFSSARHHLGVFKNVGITATYALAATASGSTAPVLPLEALIYAALSLLIQKHPVLAAIPVDEGTASPYFVRLPQIDLARCVTFLDLASRLEEGEEDPNDAERDALLQHQHNRDFKPVDAEQPSQPSPCWRVVVLRPRGVESPRAFTAAFIYHHALGDGVSGLIFQRNFLSALRSVTASQSSAALSHEVGTPATPLQPPLERLCGPQQPPTPRSTDPRGETWTGSGLIQLPVQTRLRTLTVPAPTTRRFTAACRGEQTTLTATLGALIARALFQALPARVQTLECTVPIDLRRWLAASTHDAMGVWIDAFPVVYTRGNTDMNPGEAQKAEGPPTKRNEKDTADDLTALWHQSRRARTAIATYLATGGTQLNVAKFAAIPNMPAHFRALVGTPRSSSFDLSNLGVVAPAATTADRVENEGADWKMGRVLFTRSAFAAGSALSFGTVTGPDGALTIGCSWQHGVVEEEVVGRVISSLNADFEHIAANYPAN